MPVQGKIDLHERTPFDVTVGILTAVEPGFQPSGQNRPHF
jgi:hypothetical protein